MGDFETAEEANLQTQILTYLQEHLDEYVEDLRCLTAVDSGTHHKPGVDAVQSWLQNELQTLGFTVERIPQSVLGDNLLAHRKGGGGQRILLLGHADTVFPVGTAAARPLCIDGNSVLGPGTCDMKGGLLTGLYALRALDAVGWEQYGSVHFLIVSDEEIQERCGVPLIRQAAQAADVAFTLEAARANGDIVTARKSAVWATVRVAGQAAHAGVEPEKGRNAILALARHLVEIDRLNNWVPGVTVNIGRVAGGTQPNVVVEEAWAQLDLRAWRDADLPPLIAEIRARLAQPVLDGTRAVLEVNPAMGMPAMQHTPAVAALEKLTQQLAARLGFSVAGTRTGGASDASFVAAEGVPVLDGLGPIGGLDHSPQEYIELSSIVPRTALLALLLAETGAR
jgi:glutamate carboxypeptidase